MWGHFSARKVLQKEIRGRTAKEGEEDWIQTGAYLQAGIAERGVIQEGAGDVRYFLTRRDFNFTGEGSGCCLLAENFSVERGRDSNMD